MNEKNSLAHKERANRSNLIVLIPVIVLYLVMLFSCTEPNYPRITRKANPSSFCSQYLNVVGDKSEADALSSSNKLYMDNQVIITGALDQINEVKRKVDLGNSSAAAVPLMTIPLDIFSNNSPVFVTQYILTSGTVEAYVEKFNTKASSLDFQLAPFAEPNYIIREPGDLEIEGDPGSSSVEVDAAAAPYAANLTYSNFIEQWAFFDGRNFLEQSPSLGENVTILVFDTSPLSSGDYHVDLSDSSSSEDKSLRYAYDLCVNAPINDNVAGSVFNSHGLFIANLAHTVAPGSNIVLVEALQTIDGGKNNVEVKGNILTLLNLMQLHLDKATDLEQKVVVNLSLGFGFHPDNAGPFLEKQINSTKEALITFAKCKCSPIYNLIPSEVSEISSMPVYSMQLLLHSLWNDSNSNIVYIAAAGNDGRSTESQSPADYPNVIGVSGNNRSIGASDPVKSCFSNQGDVIAPAGDGIRVDKYCMIKLQEACPDPGNCDKALISLIINEKGQPTYAFWAGTSFSAPLISGHAAKIFGSEPDLSSSETRCLLDPTGVDNNRVEENPDSPGQVSATPCPP